MEPTEQWRPVVGYEGLYEVSDHGRVKSLDRIITHRTGHRHRHRGKIMNPFVNEHGYAEYNLRSPGKRRLGRAHVLVLEAFIGPRPKGLVACHNDGDGSNNHVSNLRWDTYGENNHDLVRHDRHWQSIKTHCKNGHEFTPKNTILRLDGGHRKCRTCQAIANARRYADGGKERRIARRAKHTVVDTAN